MKTICIVLLAGVLFVPSVFAQRPDVQPFLPGIIGQFPNVRDIAISPNRNEVYFTAQSMQGDLSAIFRINLIDNEWTDPELVDFSGKYMDLEPSFSPDGLRLYFASNRPLTQNNSSAKDYDIWYVERQAGTWSEPKNAGRNINTDKDEYYISFTKSGKMYFSSNKPDKNGVNNFDIYSSELKDGEFQPPIKLGVEINTSSYEADVYIAPDESYVVFSANRPGGLGQGDLFVSFRKKDGMWSPAKSLGNTINTATDDFCPYVSPDGKYLFYASKKDIYWVSTDVFKKL